MSKKQSRAAVGPVNPEGRPGRARLVLLKGGGGDGASYTLSAMEHVAGRDGGTILFPDDQTVSPEHANFYYRGGTLYVRDLMSANGTFLRLRGRTGLDHGDRFVCGEQMFELRLLPDPLPRWVDETCFSGSPEPEEGSFQLVQILAGDRPGLARHYATSSITIGREGCTLSFPTDRFMSHEHARIVRDGDGFALEDAGSKNGSYFRIQGEAELQDGDTLFIGKQLVRIDI